MGETLLGKAALCADAKKELRIKHATQDIEENVEEVVSSALDDMSMRNVDTARICPDGAALSEMKSLGVRAVKFYVKANYGISSKDDAGTRARYQACYDALVNSMSLSREYRKMDGD